MILQTCVALCTDRKMVLWYVLDHAEFIPLTGVPPTRLTNIAETIDASSNVERPADHIILDLTVTLIDAWPKVPECLTFV